MAGTDCLPTVADAGPIIHLDELGFLNLLGDFGPLLVPRAVWDEVVRHRCASTHNDMPGGSTCLVDVSSSASPRLQALVDSFRLDAGESAALALMESRGAQLFLCDDAAARLAAESLGFRVHGTLGILIRSIRRGQCSRADVVAALRSIPRLSTLHISRALLVAVIAQVESGPN